MDSLLLPEFSEVVGSIYEAALNPELWPIAVAGIAHLHRSPKANFLTPSVTQSDGGFIFPFGLTESMLQIWDAKFRSDDIWFQAASRRKRINSGQVSLNDDLMTREEFEASRHYREFLREIDISDICTAVIFDGTAPATLPSVLSVFRGHRDPRFTEANRKLHSLLTSHVSRALGVMFRLRFADMQIASNIAALDRLSTGILLFGERGNVVFANKAGGTILGRDDNAIALRAGNPMADGLGWLSARHTEDDLTLKREIATAVSRQSVDVMHFNQGISVRRGAGRNPILLQLSALPPENEFSSGERLAFAVGFLSDPDRQMHLDAKLLERAYQLTKAECQLAQELLLGDSIKEIGARRKVSSNTINSQLDSIFAKTGTHRQAQLVRLLTAFVMPD